MVQELDHKILEIAGRIKELRELENKTPVSEAVEEVKEAAEDFVDELKETGETLKDAVEDLKEE